MAAEGSALSNYLRKALLLGGTALLLIAAFALVWSKASRRTYRRLYRLGPPGAQVGGADLRRAADVLAARFRALRGHFNMGRCAVAPLPPDRLELTFSTSDEPERVLAWATMQGRAELRLLHPRADVLDRLGPDGLPPDYEVKVYRERRFLHTRLNEVRTVEHFYAVQCEPVLTVAEFAGVDMQTSGLKKSVVLTFRFKEEDARVFAGVTAVHAGRGMAMLIDGEMFFPPRSIETAVTGGEVQVIGFFRIPLQRKLAAMLDCGSLPYSLAPIEEPPPAGAAG
jgi:hypothetical protein